MVLDPLDPGVALEFTMSDIKGNVKPALGPVGTVYVTLPSILGSLSSVYSSFRVSNPMSAATGPAGNS